MGRMTLTRQQQINLGRAGLIPCRLWLTPEQAASAKAASEENIAAVIAAKKGEQE
jgi:ABC-type transport system involved in cytochrome bd biosynthesis fused ATPase/permease subunit